MIQRLDLRTEAFGKSISIAELLGHSHQKVDLILRRLFYTAGQVILNTQDVQQIRSQFFCSQEDAQPSLQVDSISVKRFKSRLYLLSNLPSVDDGQTPNPIRWDSSDPLLVTIKDMHIGYLSLSRGKDSIFDVRFRSGGERFRSTNTSHSRSLKKILQDKVLEPWLRPMLPIIYDNDQIIAVAGVLNRSEYEFQWRWCDPVKSTD